METKNFILRPTADETRDLVRQALVEAFPGIEFKVAVEYDLPDDSGMLVKWTDGPALEQVGTLISLFSGLSLAMLDGKPMLSTTMIYAWREYSDKVMQQMTDTIVQRRPKHTVPKEKEVLRVLGRRSFVQTQPSPTAARITLLDDMDQYYALVRQAEAEALNDVVESVDAVLAPSKGRRRL